MTWENTSWPAYMIDSLKTEAEILAEAFQPFKSVTSKIRYFYHIISQLEEIGRTFPGH